MEKDKRPDEELVFRYSREDRLRRSSDAVRRLNDPASRKRPTLFQTLAPNRASAFLLLGILMLSMTLMVSKFLIPAKNIVEIAGNRLTLTAFRYQGGTYLALKKKTLRDDAYRGPIDISISGGEGADVISTRSLVLGPQDAEEFRLSIDGEHRLIQVVASAGASRGILRTEAE